MGKYENPNNLNFNGGDYATSTDAQGNVHIHNRQGRETWQSEYDNNVRETRENNEAQRQRAAESKKQQQAEQRKRQQDEEERKRRASRQRSASGGSPSGSGLAGFFLGTAGLALPFVFNGILVIILAVLGKILSPVMPLIQLIRELFWMFLTCWIRVLKNWFTGAKYGVFFKDLRCRWIFPVEMAIAIIFLISTLVKSIRGDDFWHEDEKNLKPLIIFPVLELLHSFTTIGTYYTYGHLKSIANGLFLGMQLLIVMGWIIRFIEDRKYR